MALKLATATLQLADGPVQVAVGEATPEQQLQCCRLAGTAFAAPLSQGQYVELEDYLGSASLPLAVEGARRYWCIFLANDPNCILATCKTLHRFFLVRHGSAALRESDAYCIASVITNPDYRRSGLASVLLGHVAKWMDGPGAGVASMLYTSIGDYYSKRGWGPLPAFESTLKCSTNPSLHVRSGLPGTRFLTGRDIDRLCASDVEGIKREMQKTHVSAGQTLAAVLPTSDLITLLQGRAEFIALRLFNKVTERRGAITQSEETWVYWYHDFRKHQLAILRIHTSEKPGEKQSDELSSLLLHALQEASAWALPKVTIWDANPAVREALDLLKDRHAVEVASGQREQRSIPSLRWNSGQSPGMVMFHCNEFYAWS